MLDGAIQQLLDGRKWIYPSERVEKILEKVTEGQLYSVFNSQHHMQSSTQLFQFVASMNKKVSVVCGHKAQGKIQFLFLSLQASSSHGGGGALFLDKSICLVTKMIRLTFMVQSFVDTSGEKIFLQIGGEVKDCWKHSFKMHCQNRLDDSSLLFANMLATLEHVFESLSTMLFCSKIFLFDFRKSKI